MPNTSRGYTYPASTADTAIWLHFQELATDIDADVDALAKIPVVRLVQQAAQTALTTGTDTVLTFGTGTEEIDTHGFHSETTNNSRITPNKPGIYEFTVKPVYAASNTIQSMNTFLRKNGGTYERSGNLKPATIAVNQASTPLITLVAANGTTDYFEAGTTFGGTANQATNAVGGSTSVFQCKYIRPL